MPYRDSDLEAPDLDAARRRHGSVELGHVRKLVNRLEGELEREIAMENNASARLDAVRAGRGGGWFSRPDPDVLEQEVADARTSRGNAEATLEIARRREGTLAAFAATSRDETIDPSVEVLAVTASIRAAADLRKTVRAAMRDAAELVRRAHEQEMVAALTGETTLDPTWPRADRALGCARCHVELLRASLVGLDESRTATVDEVIRILEAAGRGPGQQWKDRVLAATSMLDSIVDALDRV